MKKTLKGLGLFGYTTAKGVLIVGKVTMRVIVFKCFVNGMEQTCKT